jgi:type VI secretion system secreted protein Hcp
MKIPRVLVSLLVALSVSAAASAAVYIKIEGIDGESKDKAHAGWIAVEPQVDLDVPTTRAAGGGLSTGQRMHKPLVIRKSVDKASPLLAKAMATRQEFGQVQVSRPSGRITLSNVMVTSITTAGGVETVSLTYQKIEAQQAVATPRGSGVKEKAQPPTK